MFYKLNVGNSPEFLCDLITPSVGETNNYNLRTFKYGGFILHILHSLFDKMLYSVYVHSKNNNPILYGSI